MPEGKLREFEKVFAKRNQAAGVTVRAESETKGRGVLGKSLSVGDMPTGGATWPSSVVPETVDEGRADPSEVHAPVPRAQGFHVHRAHA